MDVKVVLHAWVDELHNLPPGDVYMSYLTRLKELETNSISTVEKCLSISDALVFDFLIDGML